MHRKMTAKMALNKDIGRVGAAVASGVREGGFGGGWVGVWGGWGERDEGGRLACTCIGVCVCVYVSS
jgi:hypothetical protein